jgi:tagatose-1,6-bisphosphate aldolase non-catalytic subunit AgaZ/GatZ
LSWPGEQVAESAPQLALGGDVVADKMVQEFVRAGDMHFRLLAACATVSCTDFGMAVMASSRRSRALRVSLVAEMEEQISHAGASNHRI